MCQSSLFEMAALNLLHVRDNPVCSQDECSPFDIGIVFQQIARFPDAEKLRFIQNIWKPDPLFVFPATLESGGRLRKFKPDWLVRFPWLVYSKYLDGAFCLPCVCFGIEFGRNGSKLDKLFRSPLSFWTSATAKFQQHSCGKSEVHNYSAMAMQKFLQIMRKQVVPVDQQLDRLMQEQIRKNREIMKSIVKTVLFCGQHNIPLRGKRDDNPDNRSLQGNFQALLDFRVDSGDEQLRQHLENAPRNATYRSKTIQNEIIDTLGKHIVSKVVSEVTSSSVLFSIMADEAADISNKENLSLVLRYVDALRNIREEFIGFRCCEETTGESIKNIIMSSLSDLGLCMDNCRGQSYDGAGNMAGRYVGAATLIQNQFPKAVYVHCMNHRLNLCVAKTCSLPLVRNMMGTVRKLSEFFANSPKRQNHLVERVKELLPNNNHTILIDVCRTRWIGRLDGLDRVIELIHPVLTTLEDIILNNGATNWNSKSKEDAQSLTNAITFDFLVTLFVVQYILNLTRPATVRLQKENMDIIAAEQEIASLKGALKDMQNNIDHEHNHLYQNAVDLAQQLGIEPSMPRIVQVQMHRNNAPATNPEIYYRRNLTTTFLNHAITQINLRFPPEAYICFKGFFIVPSLLLKDLPSWKTKVEEFCCHYQQDIPNPAGLPAELHLWERLWKDKASNGEDIPDKVSSLLAIVDPPSFPNVFTMLKILAIIPVTSCSCERSISCLRNLKTYLRSTMGEDRLNGLALMHTHRQVDINLDEVVDLFANLHPRRIRMENILCSD